jgi:hypothetical protein
MPNTERVLAAIGRILRPIVRILIRNGVPSDALTQLVRKTYVDVAAAEFQLNGKRQTVSRISVITGLHRKEVARLRSLNGKGLGTGASARNRAAAVLTAWLRDPDFLDRKGDPLDLPFAGTNSFSELVRRYSGDMKPRAMADELLASGAIENSGGRLRLSARGYVPGADTGDLIAMLGTDTAQLIDTIDHNLRNPDKRYQRKVEYINVSREHAAEFRELSARLSQHLLEELDRWLASRGAQGTTLREPTMTLGLGIFQIEESGGNGTATGGNGPVADEKTRNEDHETH